MIVRNSILKRLIIGVVIFFGLKVLLAAKVQLLPEEAYYWNYSMHLALGYLDHPPLSAWCIALGNYLLGCNELGVRAATICFGLVTTFLLYHLTRRVYGSEAAAWSIPFSTLLPFFVGNGFYASPDAPLAVAWAAVLLLAVRILSDNERVTRVDWGVLGVCFGVGLLAKYTIALLALSLLVLFLSKKELRRWFYRPEPYVSGIVALIFFSPVIYWNATHEWASLLFQSTRRLEEPSRFSLHQYLLYLTVLATPVGVYLIGREVADRKERSTQTLLLLLSFVVPNIVFCLFTLSHPARLNWPGVMLVGMVPVFSDSIVRSLQERGPHTPKLVKVWSTVLGISGVVFLGLWTYLGVGIPFAAYSTKMSKLIGWEDLASQVSVVAGALSPSDGKRSLVVGLDKHYTPAELNFYLHKRCALLGCTPPEVEGRNVFGLDSLMFEYWSAHRTLNDYDPIILVARSREDIEREAVLHRVALTSPVVEYLSTTNGKASGRYFYGIAASLLSPP